MDAITARGRIGTLVLLRPARNIQRPALILGFAVAQDTRDGERPLRPDNASNAAIGGWCDALTGAKKEQCLRDERKRREEKPAVEVDARTNAGAASREAAASQ